MKQNISPEVVQAAQKIAKSTQKNGQTKQQTKLISQGIEKGIAEYKKQQNKKLRALDKQRKRKVKPQVAELESVEAVSLNNAKSNLLPWGLLILSWVIFAIHIIF